MSQFLYRYVDTRAWNKTGLSPFNFAICVLIIVSVLLAVIDGNFR
ncbi:MAG: voltage-gated potassium channel [Marinobacter psychrophilus]|jgi:voltage-gated potassium channel